ncbi:MAG: type II toxin-antitoxin system HicA family toxin [Spirochaetaceae bacterium]|jgi:hypothetical protein|nr:type II toxin-antitoxin system HicA family toxin [Spirochaetaceae bacterium]
MKGFYPIVIRILRNGGFEFLRNGKGDHEVWSKGKIKVSIPYNLDKKPTANDILKKAGLSGRV